MIPFSNVISQQYMQLMNLDIYLEREEWLTVNKSRMNEYYYKALAEGVAEGAARQKL